MTQRILFPIRNHLVFGFTLSEQPVLKVSAVCVLNISMVTGKLKCSGQSTDSTDLVSTCSSLKKSGLSSNGFYLTKVNIIHIDLFDVAASRTRRRTK